ncbi:MULTISPECIES: hydroxymethylbilane synthase [unclassified Clostridium]|nr:MULTISPECIES: hydroxymethylbilane synthase [unclassified Clostridium]KGK86947.1 porphobilinogen deaminase [Clostridium sp. HMP27]
MNIIVATRKSALAQTQTNLVINEIEQKHNVKCEKLLIETTGDKILDRTLDKIGGKGLFIKEIEMALLEDRAHIAVHSMKDMPYELPLDFIIGAIPEREDVRDVLVSRDNMRFKDLPKGAKIGTSSRRRASELKLLRPDLEIVPIRGNVQTRIDKIEKLGLHGTILAAAGLKRLQMEHVIAEYFNPQDLVPAVGQGALGIEIKSGSPYIKYIENLDDKHTRICVEAERSFMRALKGDCHSTIGAYAQISGSDMNIVGIFEVNGEVVKKDITGNVEDYINLGNKLAEKIME